MLEMHFLANEHWALLAVLQGLSVERKYNPAKHFTRAWPGLRRDLLLSSLRHWPFLREGWREARRARTNN